MEFVITESDIQGDQPDEFENNYPEANGDAEDYADAEDYVDDGSQHADPIVHYFDNVDEDNSDSQSQNKNIIVDNIKIPKRIFQTHKSIKYIQSKPKIINAMNSWRRYVPEFGYHFYTDEMCDEFMKTEMVEEFGDVIYEAYNKLTVSVMKADLWRYCVIYKYGGIYADADAICKCDPKMFTLYDTMLVCGPEPDNIHLCQWCFAAPAKSPILKDIIELSIKRVMKVSEIKGEHVIHFLTGPGVFTDGIEKYLSDNDMPVFKNKFQYYQYKNATMICFAAERFHKMMIEHLFAGDDNDGWKQERTNRLM